MKRGLLISPFLLLAFAAAALPLFRGAKAEVTLGVLFMIALGGCLICVPIVSKRNLWLGYIALVFPFLMLSLEIAFGPPPHITTTVSGEIKWHQPDEPIDGFLKRLEEHKKKPIPPQPADEAIAPRGGR